MTVTSIERPPAPHAAHDLTAHLDVLDHHDILLLNRLSNMRFHGLGDWAPNWRDWWKPGDRRSLELLPDGIQPDGTIVVTIAPQDYELAKALGGGRQVANRNAANSEGYSGGQNNPERTAQMDAVLCEMAVAQHLGLTFNVRNALWKRGEHNQYRAGSDLEQQNIEVRSIKKRGNAPAVKAKDRQDSRTVYITMPLGTEAYQVLILGCMSAAAMWAAGNKPGWWDRGVAGSTRGPWNPYTSDRTVTEANLTRCPCTQNSRLHAYYLAGSDNPPTDYEARVRPGPRPDETPALTARHSLRVE